jgi:hypothetical protein
MLGPAGSDKILNSDNENVEPSSSLASTPEEQQDTSTASDNSQVTYVKTIDDSEVTFVKTQSPVHYTAKRRVTAQTKSSCTCTNFNTGLLENEVRNKKRRMNIHTCPSCRQTGDCHEQLYSDLIEQAIENHATMNNMKTMTQAEVYKEYTDAYNFSINFQHVQLTGGRFKKEPRVLPGCMYNGSFSMLVNQWHDNGEEKREEVRNHIAWMKRDQKEMCRRATAKKRLNCHV